MSTLATKLFFIGTSLTILVCLSVGACKGSSEAWRHRVSGEPATIRFGCDGFFATEQRKVLDSAGHVSLTVKLLDRRKAENEAGELFSHHPGQRIPVTFEEPLPNDVIASDARRLLTSLGYVVEQEYGETVPNIEIAVSQLDSGQEQGRWTELKGTTWSQMDLIVTVVRGSDVDRTWALSQREEIRVTYFLASQMQSTLVDAYCRILGDLSFLFRSDDFVQILRPSNQ